MKATLAKRLPALILAAALTGITPPALRAQSVVWLTQSFDGNICGVGSPLPATSTYDPTQDDTGDGGGSCHISTDYSQGGVFEFYANNVACCGCKTGALFHLSDYNTVEFDVKWDNASTVPLSFFNANFGGGTEGVAIGVQTGAGFVSFCYSKFIIPDAATNGWVHISAAINPGLTNTYPALTYGFVAISFEKAFPAYGASKAAAFWLDNLELVGPTFMFPVSQGSYLGGNFTFSFLAIKGETFSVFKSTDLVNWSGLLTGYPPGGTTATDSLYTILSFTDTNANGGQGYYLIRRP